MAFHYLYVMDNATYRGEFYKFGYTKNPHKRLTTADTQLPTPHHYLRLWKINNIPEPCLEIEHHDDVVKVVIHHNELGYDIRHFNKGGGTEFFTGNPDEVARILSDQGYELKLISLNDIDPSTDDATVSVNMKSIMELLGIQKREEVLNVPEIEPNTKWSLRPYQQEAIQYATIKLLAEKRIYIELATGGGKSYIVYSLLKNINAETVVILSPRQIVNQQNASYKYTQLLGNVCSVYNLSINPEPIEDFMKKDGKKVIIACIQSYKKIWKYMCDFDLHHVCFWFDEAHWGIDDWLSDKTENIKQLLLNDTSRIEYRIFTSASPDRNIVNNNMSTFGELYKPVKISELISLKWLCPIKSYVYCEDKANSDILYFILHHFTNMNKTHGFSFHQNQANASSVFCEHYKRFTNGKTTIKPYLLTSDFKIPGNVQIDNIMEHMCIEEFEKTTNSMGYVVAKYSMGYDFKKLDFICFSDYKMSPKDIIQSIGRGTRPDCLGENGCNRDKQLDVLLPVFVENEGLENFQRIAEVLAYLLDEVELSYEDIIFTKGKTVHSNDVNIITYEGGENIKSLVFECTKYILNRGNKITYSYVRKINKRYRFTTRDQYLQSEHFHQCYVNDPEVVFSNEFVCWCDFLCMDTSQFPPTKESFINYCKDNGIKNSYDYICFYTQNKNIQNILPIDPFQMYANFTNWNNELREEEDFVW